MNKFAIISLVVVAMAAGVLLQHYYNQPTTTTRDANTSPITPSASPLIGQQRPDFQLPDLDDETRDINEWDGKVRLLNFWATWCPPCKREMPAFIDMQEQYGERGFQVIGIAIDRKDSVQDFVDTIGVNYPVLYGETETMALTQLYGNRLGVLPYSVFIDKDGTVISTHSGEVTAETIETIILPRL